MSSSSTDPIGLASAYGRNVDGSDWRVILPRARVSRAGLQGSEGKDVRLLGLSGYFWLFGSTSLRKISE